MNRAPRRAYPNGPAQNTCPADQSLVCQCQAKGAADRVSAAVTDNPAKEFANKGKAAVRENLPVDGPAEWDLSSLQVNVSQKLQAQASNTAKQASSKVCSPSVADTSQGGGSPSRSISMDVSLCWVLLLCAVLMLAGLSGPNRFLIACTIARVQMCNVPTSARRRSAWWRASRTRPSSPPRRRRR